MDRPGRYTTEDLVKWAKEGDRSAARELLYSFVLLIRLPPDRISHLPRPDPVEEWLADAFMEILRLDQDPAEALCLPRVKKPDPKIKERNFFMALDTLDEYKKHFNVSRACRTIVKRYKDEGRPVGFETVRKVFYTLPEGWRMRPASGTRDEDQD